MMALRREPPEPVRGGCRVARGSTKAHYIRRRCHHQGIKYRDRSSFTRLRRLASARRGHRLRRSVLGYRAAVQECGLERRILRPLLRLCRVSDHRRRRLHRRRGARHGPGLRRRHVHGRHQHDAAERSASRPAARRTARSFSSRTSAQLDEFESGSFEFAAGASAIAVTAGANASAGTTGAESGASGGKKDATTNAAGTTRGWRCSPSPRAASCTRSPSPARNSATRRECSPEGGAHCAGCTRAPCSRRRIVRETFASCGSRRSAIPVTPFR